MSERVIAACDAIEKAWELTPRLRGLCPSTDNPQSLVGAMGYRSGDWYRKLGIDFLVTLQRPMTLEDATSLNQMGAFVNSSFIIRMAAILEGYGFTPYGESVDETKNCWEYAKLTKGLRNYFVHREYKTNPTAEDLKKSRDTRQLLMDKFPIAKEANHEFPTSIDSILKPLKDKVLEYVRSFA